jgi:hypothetical protein
MRNGRQSSEEVLEVLGKAAYFSIFSVPDLEQRSHGVPLIPFGNLLYKISIVGSSCRHQVTASPPSPSHGFRSRTIGSEQRIARQKLTLEVMPNSFEPHLGRRPPPTLLLPFLSQRFCTSEGELDFLDAEGSAVRAFAAGRFFPGSAAGSTYLRIGGVMEILECLGRLRGLIGNVVVNGYTTPPDVFANNYIIRLIDTEGRLSTTAPIAPVERPTADPEPNSAFIPLMAELEPGHPLLVEPSGDSNKKRIRMVERLHLVDNAFDVRPTLHSRTVPGPAVGLRRSTLVFDPDDPSDVIPLYSTDSELMFFAEGDRRKRIGSVRADLFEGRAFRTTLPQLARPFFRVTGYGPFITGTGQFEKTLGLVSINGALSLDPPAFTAMCMLRMADPVGRFDSASPEPARRSA